MARNFGRQFRTALLLVALLSVSAPGCATRALWQVTDPNRYVRIRADQVSETELTQRGLDYRKSDNGNAYFVQKTVLRRAADYSARAILTPLTAAFDVTIGFAVVAISSVLPGMPEEPPDRACNDLEEDCAR